MEPFATVQDLEAEWRPLAPDERETAERRLSTSSLLIRRLKPSIDDEIADDEVLGMGDSENDLSWLTQVGLPIAMENAFDNVKAVCTYEIGKNEDDSAAAFIHQWADYREDAGLDTENAIA